MSNARILGGAAVALLVLAGACQRRPDSGLGAGGSDSSASHAARPASPPDTARPDSVRQDTTTGTATPVTPRSPTTPVPPARRDSARRRVPAPVPAPDRTAENTAAPAPPAGADQPLRDAYHTAPLDTVDAKTYQGWKYFNLNCARCHGEDVQGTTIAPHLILSLKPDGTIPNEEAFQTTVCGGRVAKGMPAWCSLGLTPAQIDTIYTYVKGRSDAKLHPGRPARRE